MRGQDGFALVLALVVTTLMVAAVSELIHQVYVDTAVARGYRDGQQASLNAETGVRGAIRLLVASRVELPPEPQHYEDAGGTLDVTVTDEAGKLELNGLVYPNGQLEPGTLGALTRLGARLGIDPAAWTSLADWLDSDGDARQGGAESAPGYAPRNGRLETLAELALVRGFSPETIERLAPFVTVHSTGGPRVNVNTAPLEVLAALDESIDDPLARRIIAERRIAPFAAIGELSRVRGELAMLMAGRVRVQGGVFRITARARSGGRVRCVEAVVRTGDGRILTWQEY